jgi:hypothetical protein
VQVANLNAGANATWRTDVTFKKVPEFDFKDYKGSEKCRCCGDYVPAWYAYGDNSEFNIHSMCIAKHWGKHAKHVNHSRCKEFKKK